MNDLVAEKKKYIKPITESFPMIEKDFIANTPENYNSHLDDEQDDWGEVDTDDDIVW